MKRFLWAFIGILAMLSAGIPLLRRCYMFSEIERRGGIVEAEGILPEYLSDLIGSPASLALSRVRTISFSIRPVTDSFVIQVLSHCDCEAIEISGEGVTDEGVVSIGSIVDLRVLRLSRTSAVGDFLASSRGFRELRTLGLQWCPEVSDRFWMTIPELAHLQYLSLRASGVVDPSAARVIAKKCSATELDLAYTDLDDESLAILLERTDFQFLDISYTRVSSRMAEQARRMLPKCEVVDRGLE